MATVCETTNCGKEAKLRCPTCVKLDIAGSYFCSQDCFKSFWKEHKVIHSLKDLKTTPSAAAASSKDEIIWPGYKFSGALRPFKQSPKRAIPPEIERPDYADDPTGTPKTKREFHGAIRVLNEEEIEAMRVTCKLAREVLEEGVKAVGVGVTTDEIDRVIHEATIERDCYPSPLNYYSFPKSCCTSVNEVICHGIPDSRPLADGDILNIDVTVFHHGFHGDLNESVFVGQVDEASKVLVKTTHECLSKAIDAVRPGVKYRDIGEIIQKHAQTANLSVVRTYCGHGIHRIFHTSPNVPHYARSKAIGVMKPGHCFTIEPMINIGTWRDDRWPDEWTAVTQDGKRSAQFEETLLVTESGCEVLTARRDPYRQPYFMDK